MTYQVFFSENVEPSFNHGQRAGYRKLVSNQVYPIGNIVNGRRLLRCLTADFAPIQAFLEDLGKGVIICDVRDVDGVRYGYERVQDDVNKFGEPTYIIQPILDEDGNPMPTYPINEKEYNLYMQPVDGVDENGDPTTIPAVSNTSAGWAAWNERI